MSLRLSKKGVIPYLPSEAAAQAGLIRDLLSLIKAGDTGSGSGMTVPVMNRLIERPFVGSLTCWLPNTMILSRTQVKYQLNNHEDITVISLLRLKNVRCASRSCFERFSEISRFYYGMEMPASG